MSRHPDRPLISIVTPCLNAIRTIRETLESLAPQLADDVEHLLIDACSTDGTLEIAREYSHLTIQSERDCGIYDGMNKGVSLACGEWILFLQADDWLPARTLDAYRKAISEAPMADVICGSAEAVKESGNQWSAIWSVKDTNRKKLSVENIALGEPMINARLFRKSFLEKLGGFSLKYSLASDRDFLLRAAMTGVIQYELDAMTYRYRWHEGSSTMTNGTALSGKLRRENLHIAKRHQELLFGNDKKAIRDWRSKLAVELAMNAIERPNMGLFIESFLHGFNSRSWWIFSLCSEIIRCLPGYFARGFRTRTMVETSHE
jgi:glycosyltransferase involved in cell wall biosynthesis